MKKYYGIPALFTFLALLPVITIQSAPLPTADTTYFFYFKVNMTKAVLNGIFEPEEDSVYVDFEGMLPSLQLVKSINHWYDGIILTGLDSGKTYDFRFRINDTIVETVEREATAWPGTTTISAWWNDDYLNVTTFRIDMTYMLDSLFDPGSDVVKIAGTMNNWVPSPAMQQTDTTNWYQISYPLEPGETYQYKYLIQKDTLDIYEVTDSVPRQFRAPDTLITVPSYFDDFNPDRLKMIFACTMNYQIEAGYFTPGSDYLDIAGTFNNWGNYDLLYDTGSDSLYKLTLFFDTTQVILPPVQFKFRINGLWQTAELQGENPRFYQLHQPTPENPNFFTCWFDNLNPYIPTPPWVTAVTIQGTLATESVLTGMYIYHDINGIPEKGSRYQWYHADSYGGELTPLDSASTINYLLDSLDIGKYMVFEVTPVAGDSVAGETVRVFSSHRIYAVGIDEPATLRVHYYPNPVRESLAIETVEQNLTLVILDGRGQKVLERQIPGTGKQLIPLDFLNPGFYIIRFTTPGKQSITEKLIRF